MERKGQAVLESLIGIQVFMDDHVGDLGSVNQSGARAALDESVRRLTEHGNSQVTASKAAQGSTEDRDRVRAQLRVEHLQPIAAIAGSRLAAVTDIANLRVPRSNASPQRLLAAAETMAVAAEKYKQVFLDEQLPEDFVEQLRAAAVAVRTATAQRSGSLQRQVEATDGVEKQVARARAVVRILNSLVVKKLAGQEATLRSWRFAKHVVRKPGVPRGTSVAAAEVSAASAPVVTPATAHQPVEVTNSRA